MFVPWGLTPLLHSIFLVLCARYRSIPRSCVAGKKTVLRGANDGRGLTSSDDQCGGDGGDDRCGEGDGYGVGILRL